MKRNALNMHPQIPSTRYDKCCSCRVPLKSLKSKSSKKQRQWSRLYYYLWMWAHCKACPLPKNIINCKAFLRRRWHCISVHCLASNTRPYFNLYPHTCMYTKMYMYAKKYRIVPNDIIVRLSNSVRIHCPIPAWIHKLYTDEELEHNQTQHGIAIIFFTRHHQYFCSHHVCTPSWLTAKVAYNNITGFQRLIRVTWLAHFVNKIWQTWTVYLYLYLKFVLKILYIFIL